MGNGDSARSLWLHRDFLLLWSGSTVSEMGSAVTQLALPLLAVTTLRAPTFQVGLLSAAGYSAFLVAALPAGALVDRYRKRPLMLGADWIRAAILLSVPLAAAVVRISIVQLYVVAFAAGLASVVFDIAYQSFVPSLVGRQRLVEANTKMGLPGSIADVAGPTVGGLLIAAVGAAMAVTADAASFAVSGAMLTLMKTREERRAPADRRSGWRSTLPQIAEGLRYVAGQPTLRRIVACTATSNAGNAMRSALLVVFLARDLHAGATTIGLVFSFGSGGALIGGFVANSLSRRLGSTRALWLGKATLGWTMLLIPLAQPGWRVVFVSIGMFVGSLSSMLYNVAQVSYRQSVCPPELLGRMNASVRWIVWGTLPLGAALGGWLGATIGVRATLAVAVLLSWLSVLWIVLSPLVRQRDIPVPQLA